MLKRILLWYCLLPLAAWAQGPEKSRPEGFFLLDSMKVGEPVDFTFYFRHRPEDEVIFPDSTHNFAPFEFVRKQFFHTRTTDGQSLDSVVYTLRSFAITPEQRLSLPAYLLQGNDTLVLRSGPDRIFLQQLVHGEARPEKLAALTQLAPVQKRFNLATWLIGAGVTILVLLLIWMLFGKQLIIRYRLYVLQKGHNLFINKYNAFIDQFNKSESLQTIEQAITLWKNYLTELEGNAINSLTTKEIAAFYDEDEDVTTALRLFDKAIYGNIVSDKSSETIIAFYLLHHFADRRYEFVKDQTRNVTNPEEVPQLV